MAPSIKVRKVETESYLLDTSTTEPTGNPLDDIKGAFDTTTPVSGDNALSKHHIEWDEEEE